MKIVDQDDTWRFRRPHDDHAIASLKELRVDGSLEYRRKLSACFPCVLRSVGGMLYNRKLSGDDRHASVLSFDLKDASSKLDLSFQCLIRHCTPPGKIKVRIDILHDIRREQLRV